MYKIGAFASLCQISIQTLRYYERLGLLEPEHTDPFTHYRYYTARQIGEVNRILALKELGLSLEQIGDLIHEHIPTAQIEMMLTLKRADIQQTIEREQKRLRNIDFHLRLLEQENKMIDIDMTIKAADPIRVLSYVGTYNSDEEARAFFASATDAVKRAGVLLEHDYVIVFNEYEYDRRLEDLEIAFHVPDDYEGDVVINDEARLTVRDVPGVQTALTLMHKGVFEGENGMQETVRLAYMWMAQNGYEPLPPVRISYLDIKPDTPPDKHLRQIQIPVRKLEE